MMSEYTQAYLLLDKLGNLLIVNTIIGLMLICLGVCMIIYKRGRSG